MDFNVPFSFPSYAEKRHRSNFSVTCGRIGPGNSSRAAVAKAGVYKRDLLGHYGCVNAIEFSSNGEVIASGGDDRRLLIWDLWKTILEDKAPVSIDTPHISNINSCCFDNVDKKVATGGNDGQVIVHDIDVLKSTSVYGLSDAVYCVSPDPINATILATASDEGKVQILDTRTSDDTSPVTLADTGGSMHSVMYNSAEPRILATANSKHGIAIWDIRMPLKSLNYKSNIHNCMSVRFNSRGDKILALRRRAPPVLYDIAQTQPIFQFDHDTYYNACTLKSGCFAGLKDEFVVSGSDDFCVYLWKIPNTSDASFTQTEPYSILKGHRSIVNQVRYCHHNQMIISSGVEKLIKIWSPYQTPDNTNVLSHSKKYDPDEDERNAYSHEEYIHMVLRAGSFLSHDYTNGNTEEEPCMIAFFDSLIQREVEQSLSESSDVVSNSSLESRSGEAQGERLIDQVDDSQIFGVEEGDQQNERGDTVGDTVGERRLSAGSTTVAGSELENQDREGGASSRAEEILRLSYMEYESSSDSGSEVDEILSAMYNRYMHSREQLETQGPTGKKISSVIAQGKYKGKQGKVPGQICKQRVQHIGENLQHSDDQYLRDNARNLSILADVIDNFVDNLVANDSSTSRSVGDSSNRGVTSVVDSSRNMQANQINSIQHQGETREGIAATESRLTNPSSSSSTASGATPSQSQDSATTRLEPGRYFIPELEAFAPLSLQAVLNQQQQQPPQQYRTSTNGSTSGFSQTSTTNSVTRTHSMENRSSSVNQNGVMNGNGVLRNDSNSHPSHEGVGSSFSSETNNFHPSASTDVKNTTTSNYANRNVPSKKQTRSGNGYTSSKYSSPHTSSLATFPDSSLSSSSTSPFNFLLASTSSLSSSSSSSSSSLTAHSMPISHKSVKSSVLSSKFKRSKTHEDFNVNPVFPIKEASALSNKDCDLESNEPATFKKISKSKKRRFRHHKIGDSYSSSEDDGI